MYTCCWDCWVGYLIFYSGYKVSVVLFVYIVTLSVVMWNACTNLDVYMYRCRVVEFYRCREMRELDMQSA